MALEKNVNSFVDTDDADLYFSTSLYASYWNSKSLEEKEVALMTATQVLTYQQWTGRAVNSNQTIAFPRSDYYEDPMIGDIVAMDPTPSRILTATYELAIHVMKNPELFDEESSVKSIKVGSIELTDIRSKRKIPSKVNTLIAPLLINGGQNLWHRSN